MRETLITPGVLDSLYNWLYECAHNGSVCPSNQNICERYGFKSWSTASGAVRKLQDQGKITVMRFNRSRQVYIVATSKLTSLPRSAQIAAGHVPELPALRKKKVPANVRSQRTVDLPGGAEAPAGGASPTAKPKPAATLPAVPKQASKLDLPKRRGRPSKAKPPRARVSPASMDLPKLAQAPKRHAQRCQWIENEPSPDDSCKCLAPTLPGSPWCAEHKARAYPVHRVAGVLNGAAKP